jgi:hypothetical protein
MAFLSLGLNDEHQNLAEEKLRLVGKPALVEKENGAGSESSPDKQREEGTSSAASDSSEQVSLTEAAAPAPAVRSLESTIALARELASRGNGDKPHVEAGEPSDAAPANDNWSERGMEIIQSVLRNAQSAPTAASQPVSPQRPEASSQLPTAIEELRKQISQGIAPNFRSTPAEPPVAPPLIQADAPVTEIVTTETPVAEVLPSLMDELQQKLAAEPILQNAVEESASAAPSELAPKQIAVSNLPAELLSPVIEEIQRKLAESEAPVTPPVPPVQQSAESLLASSQPVANRAESSAAAAVAPATESPQASTATPLPAPPAVDSSAEPQPSAASSAQDDTPRFATFKFGYLPTRGLLYSIIGHEAAMFVLFLFITYVLPSFQGQKLIVGSLSSQDRIIYLPEIGGGEQGQKSPGGGESKPQQASAAPARASKGFSYPGSQAILSNPPNPTNAFQTVMRPLVVHPEPLKKLVPLPNIVQMAETRLPSDLVALKAATPRLQAPVVPIKIKQGRMNRQAKWNVPVKAPQLLAKADMPKLAAAPTPMPVAPKVEPKKQEEKPREVVKPAPIKVAAEKRTEKKSEKEVAPPSEAQIARLEMHGKSAEPLLSLSPAPLPAGSNAKVPAGEARGRFAIAPGGKLNPNSVNPGKPTGTPSDSPATGQDKSQAANAATELAANTGSGAGHNPTAGGGSGSAREASGGGAAGVGNGSGKTAGPGVGGAGTGNGRGSSGEGAGRSGQGAGTGAGAGSGAGTGAFPGISIQGGEGNEGTESRGFTMTPQTPYQMTIVATASSGGGLPDYGVFENEHVYTVYVPMQRTPQEADPTWTLQYALDDPHASDDQGQLIAPSPVMREWPQIPADLEKAYAQQQVVVYGVLGADGKLTHLSVKQTPDVKVSTPIEKALAKWVFRPAQLNNRPVAAKILIGIPL